MPEKENALNRRLESFKENALETKYEGIPIKIINDVSCFVLDGQRYYISANKRYIRKDNGFVDSRKK